SPLLGGPLGAALGEALVGGAAQQQGPGGEQLVLLVGRDVVAPVGERPLLGRLDDAVECDELGDHDLAHGGSPFDGGPARCGSRHPPYECPGVKTTAPPERPGGAPSISGGGIAVTVSRA